MKSTRLPGALSRSFIVALVVTVVAITPDAPQAQVCATDMSQIVLFSSDCDGEHTNPGSYLPDPTVPLMRIPVVFHVITNSDQSLGYIDVQTIQDQVEVLNQDFRAIPGSPGQNGTDTRIEFYLATVDPNGQPTTGVTYHHDDTWFYGPDNDYTLMESILNAVNWDPSRYYNIYTFSLITGPCTAVFNGGAGSVWDGVFVDWNAVGGTTPSCPGYHRVVTHETGHYLGLRHTFFPEGNHCSTEYCSEAYPSCYACGDLICDTNPQRSNTAQSCSGTSCGFPIPAGNYMSYAFQCMTKFTPEQAARMRCTALTYRSSLFEFATITISGEVRQQGALTQGIEVVAVNTDGVTEAASDVTDVAGSYALELLDGWQGTVEVAKTVYFNDVQPPAYSFPPSTYDDRDFAIDHIPTAWNPNGLAVNILDNTLHKDDRVAVSGDNVFVVWADDRENGDEDWELYMQSFSHSGDVRWPHDVKLADATDIRHLPEIIADGTGGVIVAWEDQRASATIYIQRFDADGTPQWPANGVFVGPGEEPQMVPDGAGGAVLVWYAGSFGPGHIFAQRVQSNGIPDFDWPSEWAVLRANGDYLFDLAITTDGTGGAIATWKEWASPSSIVVWAQRVNGDAVTQWPSAGSTVGIKVKPNPSGYAQELPGIAGDGAGGAFITFWQQIGPSPIDDYHVVAQRLGANGTPPPPWNVTNVVIDNRGGINALPPRPVSDGAGGFIVAWEYGYRTWTQKYNANGAAQWGSHISISPIGGSTPLFNIVPDGFGGANYVYDIDSPNPGLWIQSVTSTGTRPLGSNGVQVGDGASADGLPRVTSDVAGRPIVAWTGERSSDDGVYIHRVDAPTLSPVVASNVSAYNDSIVGPDEFFRCQHRLHAKWSTDVAARTRAQYRVTGAGTWTVTPENTTSSTSHWFEITGLTPGQQYELQPMSRRPGETGYALGPIVTATPEAVGTTISNFGEITIEFAGTAGGLQATFTYDTAHSTTCRINLRQDKNPPNAWGTDELVASSPHSGGHSHVISWLAANRTYNAYVMLENGGEDTMYPDGAVAGETRTIKYLTFVTPPKPGDDPPDPQGTSPKIPAKNYLSQNHPNPFNPTTTITYGLKDGGPVQLRIYDVNGALVRDLVDETQPAGVYELVWTGRDNSGTTVATGVYFLKMNIGSDLFVRKLVLLK